MRVGETAGGHARCAHGRHLHVDRSFRAPVRPGDVITAEVEVLELREDKPIARLRTTITNQDDVILLNGTALVWREPLRHRIDTDTARLPH